MKTFQWMVLAMVSMSLLIGCGGGAGSTPKETLENFRDAIVDQDANDMAACFDTNDTNRPAIEATCEMTVAMMSFFDKMAKEYGEDAIKNKKGQNPMEELKSDKWLDEVKIKEDGDKAIVTHPNGNDMNMIKKGGKWYIDTAMMIKGKTSAEDLKKAVSGSKAMTKAIEETSKKIGEDGYTAEKVMGEFVGNMMKVAMESAKK